MMEGARRATSEDISMLGELAAAALTEIAEHRGGPRLVAPLIGSEPQTLVQDRMRSPHASVWAGTIDGAIVGLGIARVADDSLGVLDVVYVLPDARGVGVGAELIDAMSGWLGEQGCDGIDAFALPGSRSAKQFFEQNGMVARLLVMHRSLG
jgi:GNAT superfamily N-acetyltransferase